MTDQEISIDTFSNTLLEQGKRFLEKAEESSDKTAIEAFNHAALLLSFSALEAILNSLADEMLLRDGLSPHDIGLLTESDVNLDDGRFAVSKRLKIFRLEDRLLFLFCRFSPEEQPKTRIWWPILLHGIDLRNKLVHPKKHVAIQTKVVRQFIEAELQCLDDLYTVLFKRSFPQAKRGLLSTLDF